MNNVKILFFSPPSGANQYGPYGNRPYSQPPPPAGSQSSIPTVAPNSAVTGGSGGNASGAPGAGPYPPGGPGQQDYYRPPEQVRVKLYSI